MVHASAKKLFRQRVAEAGQAWACAWVARHGFHIVAEQWTLPRRYGAGEVDILASRSNGEYWIFEVKSSPHHGPLPYELLRPAQRWRLLRARLAVSMYFRPVRIRFALLWVESSTGKIEFLENP